MENGNQKEETVFRKIIRWLARFNWWNRNQKEKEAGLTNSNHDSKDSTITRLVRLNDVILESWTHCLKPPYGSGRFSPEDGQTDCNGFVHMVAEQMGYCDFKIENSQWPMRANEMCEKMKMDKRWQNVNGSSAQYYANHGYLVVAGWQNPISDKSGHVAIVRPGMMTTSGKWDIRIPGVPKLANVGPAKSCRLDQGANWAFGDMPDYFVFKGKL